MGVKQILPHGLHSVFTEAQGVELKIVFISSLSIWKTYSSIHHFGIFNAPWLLASYTDSIWFLWFQCQLRSFLNPPGSGPYVWHPCSKKHTSEHLNVWMNTVWMDCSYVLCFSKSTKHVGPIDLYFPVWGHFSGVVQPDFIPQSALCAI